LAYRPTSMGAWVRLSCVSVVVCCLYGWPNLLCPPGVWACLLLRAMGRPCPVGFGLDEFGMAIVVEEEINGVQRLKSVGHPGQLSKKVVEEPNLRGDGGNRGSCEHLQWSVLARNKASVCLCGRAATLSRGAEIMRRWL